MVKISHANIYRIRSYSQHLKSLSVDDRYSRFGYPASDANIDNLILSMCYNPSDHELWYATVDDTRVGWGHMAKNDDTSWELAVSVQHEYQRRGIGNQLIVEMLAWAKFHDISTVFMNCIESNSAVQHLAKKNNLVTRHRGAGERVAAIEVPPPTPVEVNTQLWKEQQEILTGISDLQAKLGDLWCKTTIIK